MKNPEPNRFSRHTFLVTAAGTLRGSLLICRGASRVAKPMMRQLGRTGYEITTLGLGGQASLQRTLQGIDPERIILKAFDLSVNYFDTSNVYGPSQLNYGKAFQTLHLIFGSPGCNEAKRRSFVLASKAMVRHAKGSQPEVGDRSEGPPGSKAVDDLKRCRSMAFRLRLSGSAAWRNRRRTASSSRTWPRPRRERAGSFAQSDREEIERKAATVEDGRTNWFQLPPQPLGVPRPPAVAQEHPGEWRIVRLTWQTAYAGDRPISHCEIWRDQKKVGQVEHNPQITQAPFSHEDKLSDKTSHIYKLTTVDMAGRRDEAEDLVIPATG